MQRPNLFFLTVLVFLGTCLWTGCANNLFGPGSDASAGPARVDVGTANVKLSFRVTPNDTGAVAPAIRANLAGLPGAAKAGSTTASLVTSLPLPSAMPTVTSFVQIRLPAQLSGVANLSATLGDKTFTYSPALSGTAAAVLRINSLTPAVITRQAAVTFSAPIPADTRVEFFDPDTARTVAMAGAASTTPVTGTDVRVSFALATFNVGNRGGNTTYRSKMVAADHGTVVCEFTDIPALPTIASISIINGNIANYSAFHGALDLMPGNNVMTVHPVGTRMTQDVVAAVAWRFENRSDLLPKAGTNLIALIANAVRGLDRTQTDAVTRAFDQVAAQVAAASTGTGTSVSTGGSTGTSTNTGTSTGGNVRPILVVAEAYGNGGSTVTFNTAVNNRNSFLQVRLTPAPSSPVTCTVTSGKTWTHSPALSGGTTAVLRYPNLDPFMLPAFTSLTFSAPLASGTRVEIGTPDATSI